MPDPLSLRVLDERVAVCRLDARAAVPEWLPARGFLSITRTCTELSIVCCADAVPDDVRSEGPWRGLAVDGPLDFALVGVLVALATPLANAGIPLFVISTFDTDYLLVPEHDLSRSLAALRAAGHTVRA